MVSTAIFTTVTSELGLNNGTVVIPQKWWALLILIVVSLLLILAPVLTGVQAYLNHPAQADKHRVSWAGYYRLQQRIDLLLLRHAGANVTATDREEALKDLGEISREIEDLCKNSITLSRHALARAEAKVQQLMAAMPQPAAAVQPPLNSPIKQPHIPAKQSLANLQALASDSADRSPLVAWCLPTNPQGQCEFWLSDGGLGNYAEWPPARIGNEKRTF